MTARSTFGGPSVALVVTVVSSCSSPAPTPARTARMHVAHGAIVDTDGRTLLLRGANVSGAHKAAPYFDYQQPADFASLRSDWGFDSVRFLVTWAAVEPQKGVYDDVRRMPRRGGRRRDSALRRQRRRGDSVTQAVVTVAGVMTLFR